jgi:hypothetical protein
MTGDEMIVVTGCTVSYEIRRTVTLVGHQAFELVRFWSSPFAMNVSVIARNEDRGVLESAIEFLKGKDAP